MVDPIHASIHDSRNILKTEMIRRMLGMGLLGLAGGAAVRSAIAVPQIISRQTNPVYRQIPTRASILHVKPPRKNTEKVAELPPAPVPVPTDKLPMHGIANSIAKGLHLHHNGLADRGFSGLVAGDHANSIGEMPLVFGIPGALVGGMTAGYGLTDWLLGKARSKETESELDIAKREYLAALEGMQPKTASAETGLDKLAAAYEKTGSMWGMYPSPILQGQLALTTGSALAAGLATYRHLRSLDKAKVLYEALQRRQQQLHAQSPFPAVAVLDQPEEEKPAGLGKLQ